MSVKEITLDEGSEIMVGGGYGLGQFADKWLAWLERGDVILIFQNEDMSHSQLGHVFTMPWTETERTTMPSDGPLPPHGPDNATTGLGWRYLTKYVIRSKTS